MAVPRHLRYSPFNGLVVDWSDSAGTAFNDCGLPEPAPYVNPSHGCDTWCTARFPIGEAINTYDWARWLPEVIVGIEDPDEEIAASYTRQAAIEFCTKGRVLQREVVIELQRGEQTYPVFPYEGERIVGVIGIKIDNGCCGSIAPAGRCCNGWLGGIDWALDTARNELTLGALPSNTGLLRVLVWAAPTEDACEHDVFLYDAFRADITLGARLYYANAVHFRDRLLMASLPTKDSFDRAIVLAKTKAVARPAASKQRAGSGLFGNAGR